MPPGDRRAATVATLESAGAAGAALDALIAYDASPFAATDIGALDLPLADEPHLAAWDTYRDEAVRDGVLAALARRLVQLRFPIAAGISQSEPYRAATRRGRWPAPEAPGVSIDDPDGLSLSLCPTLAGRVPIVACRSRGDFVTLARALSCRNEPEPVPESMGACIIAGLNNWDRVARYRASLEARRGAVLDPGEWADAFRALVPQRALYQDRFIVLSAQPYSAVPAEAVGLAEDEWRARSIVIRAEHECTHYFTLRVFGAMRNHLLDEVIADFAGIAAAFGRYDAGLALRCLGLEAWPAYRRGGRFENYLAAPPVPDDALPALRTVVVLAARRLESLTRPLDVATRSSRARVVATLAGFTLAELAGPDAGARFAERWEKMPAARALDDPVPFG